MKKFKVLLARQKTPILSYSSREEITEGDIVIVPLRNQKIIGIVLGEDDNSSSKYELKEIDSKIDFGKVSEGLLKFVEAFSNYYMIDLSSICKMVLPITLRQNLKYKIKDANYNINLPILNEKQEVVYNEIISSNKVSVLEGVTGSGKTEVYFHVIRDYLEKGKQVLVMLPEIGLLEQISQRFEKSFNFKPGIWNSSVSVANKRDVFSRIIDGTEKVIIGTRSSLFLPYKDLGLIIIDEEHDGSYKQEENILYNARDSAILRSLYEKSKVILVSATPSIETYMNCQSGKYGHSNLSSRFGKAKLPEVKIIDMKNIKKGEFISDELKLAISNNLEEKLQTILFINRRGYAPLSLCTACGFRFACSDCSSWLVFHKKSNSLICHHCGYEERNPEKCPECGEESLINFGPGVERVAEEVKKHFPEARVQLFTKEEVVVDGAHAKILDSIEKSECDIIVGTQILAKGYHFSKVTTVGIIDGDLGGADIDLKANERCFQLLNQVSGRAGRESLQGDVYIQTFYPKNNIFELLKENNYKSFIKNELEQRCNSLMPPFTRIAAIIITGENELYTMNFAKEIRRKFAPFLKVKIMGPAPATLTKLRKSYRFRIILIAEKSVNLQLYIKSNLDKLKDSKKANVKVEIDPISFY